jgi:hypothetical protein
MEELTADQESGKPVSYYPPYLMQAIDGFRPSWMIFAYSKCLFQTLYRRLMFSHDAVDRYLLAQYGTSLEDLIYRNEDLQIGDVLLLRSH